MEVLWDFSSQLLEQCQLFNIWAMCIKVILDNTTIESNYNRLKVVFDLILDILQLMCSEGYCYFLDYMRIAYYPEANRYYSFTPQRNRKINDLSDREARDMTGLSLAQLRKMFLHFRIPEHFIYEPRRLRFTGEESFLHYLVFNRIGETKLRMSKNYFGGDPRRFTYSIRLMNNHLYDKFYHKVSGDSMRLWVPYINSFRFAIWEKLNGTQTVEDTFDSTTNEVDTSRLISLDIPFETFRIFGFLDDTGFRTTVPGLSTRRTFGFHDDVQRSFYSAYFAGHGIKVQAVTLPNGMFGSIYIGAWRIGDSGLLNMSGLDNYLTELFLELNMGMTAAYNQLPALYGDGIFPQLATIIARYNTPNENETRINRILASARESIEHLFALHANIFTLFQLPQRFKLLVNGEDSYKMIFNSFLLLNCYTCFNESPNNFNVRPPSIEVYLPLNEPIKPAPVISDNALGDVYRYYV